MGKSSGDTGLRSTVSTPRSRNPISVIFSVKETGILLGLIGLIIVFSLTSPFFLTLNNVVNIVRQISLLGIMAVGMTMVIVSGEFDLSVGSIYGMAGIILALLMTSGVPIWLAVVIALVSGATAGVLNGALTTYGRVPSLIVTLGMLNIARGFALVLSGGLNIGISKRTVSDPLLDAFMFIGRGKIWGIIPPMTIAFVVVVLIGVVFFHKNIIGFRMKAVGGNPDAARVSGINVKLIKIIAFMISGILAALGGVINISFLSNATGILGQGLELDVIAATILGGTSLTGGEGTIAGTVIGVLIIGVLRNGLVLVGVSPFMQMMIIGGVLIAAVAMDMWSRRK
jgi:ribose/xylose/arabinose/galactoside ABC-type transport system permease subunit